MLTLWHCGRHFFPNMSGATSGTYEMRMRSPGDAAGYAESLQKAFKTGQPSTRGSTAYAPEPCILSHIHPESDISSCLSDHSCIINTLWAHPGRNHKLQAPDRFAQPPPPPRKKLINDCNVVAVMIPAVVLITQSSHDNNKPQQR